MARTGRPTTKPPIEVGKTYKGRNDTMPLRTVLSVSQLFPQPSNRDIIQYKSSGYVEPKTCTRGAFYQWFRSETIPYDERPLDSPAEVTFETT